MDKKDIYEHLAKIYLDASSKKKKKKKSYTKFFYNIYFIIIFVCLGVIFVTIFFPKNKTFRSQVALVLLSDAAKINFNFNPAKKEIFSIDLGRLNLARFKTLGFAIKKKNYDDTISLRVEFTNFFEEKSEVYLKNISHKWQDYKIGFSKFKNISNWTTMKNLSFTVEEWNVRAKEGVVYIDNIRLLR